MAGAIGALGATVTAEGDNWLVTPGWRDSATTVDVGNAGTVINAADEVAVEAFLVGQLPFGRIAGVIDQSLARWGNDVEPGMDAIAATDAEVRAALRAELSLQRSPA